MARTIISSIYLRELTNRPGYGSARKALREVGLWQKTHNGIPLWTVEIEVSPNFTTYVIVAALDEDSARRAANGMTPDNLDFDNGGYLEIVRVGNAFPCQDAAGEPDMIARIRGEGA